MLDEVPDALILRDSNGNILFANRQAEILFEYSQSELLSISFRQLIPSLQDSSQLPADSISLLQLPPRENNSELAGITKSGRNITVEVCSRKLPGSNTPLTLLSIRDVSNRKLFEESTRVNQERFRLLVESVQDYAIYLLDPQGNVLSWNTGAERIKGYSSKEIVGKHFSLFYPQEALEQDWPAQELKQAIAQGRFEDEGWRLRKDGSRFWANVVITSLFEEDGSLKGFAKVTRDLTERKKHEQTIQEKNEELEKALRAKDHFLATMSHELRTPLNAILGFTGTLLMRLPGPLTQDQEKQLRTVQTSAKHLLSLINDLLDLAKVESGKIELASEWLVCRELLQEIHRSVQLMADVKKIQLDLIVSPPELLIRADRRALHQILLNLISNAIKFTESGRVVVEVHRRNVDSRVEIEFRISDSGIGIALEDQSKLFRAFTQLDHGRSGKIEGTGLGLYFSNKLAILLGGRIQVQSTSGRGSTFTLILPQE
ncbi:PAS domain S-box protein [Telmatocola sphagniphila]|uniref:histidine kinase n=1 Tax=Telmatocola sphagniphila TaxID=1123043 RepID=A0A8E6B9E7_9BACT|nr:PAS domain S-box protein [Telmatocola sphagniphila]QVL33576.1 PAS domain S-box protein [Telmatocola sphagniphila]